MKECKYCGSFYDDNLSHCPNCGGNRVVIRENKIKKENIFEKEASIQKESFNNNEKKETKTSKSFLYIILFIVMIVVICVLYSSYKPNGIKNFTDNINNTSQLIELSESKPSKYLNELSYEVCEKGLKYFSSKNTINTMRDGLVDNLDNVYDWTLCQYNQEYREHNPIASVKYQLDNKYSTLSFTIYVTKKARVDFNKSNESLNWDRATISIYGDGKSLYSKKGGYTIKTNPEYIEIDIENVNELEIQFDNAFYKSGSSIIYPLIALGNLLVK